MAFFNNMDLAFEIAALKTNEAMDELFSKDTVEEPDAEKPVEKTELSALEELLFERTHIAEVRYEEGHSEAQLARCLELCGLVGDAGLEARYYAWKKANGYMNKHSTTF